MKEYKDFREFYDIGFALVQEIKLLTFGLQANQRVKFARIHLHKDILKRYINIGILSNQAREMLESSNANLKFSIDNLVKNIIVHSEVCFEDYLKIPYIAQNPSKVIKAKNGLDIMIFKSDLKCYKMIVKTTKNKDENFIKSFHLIEDKRFNKY